MYETPPNKRTIQLEGEKIQHITFHTYMCADEKSIFFQYNLNTKSMLNNTFWI